MTGSRWRRMITEARAFQTLIRRRNDTYVFFCFFFYMGNVCEKVKKKKKIKYHLYLMFYSRQTHQHNID